MPRTRLLRVAVALTFAGLGAGAAKPGCAQAAAAEVTVFKSPTCGCCGAWVDHLREHGFKVKVEETANLAPIRARFGVPKPLESCHTATVRGYTVEGHVPAPDIRRLLDTRPAATGLAVPGMPIGSPGMEQGDRHERYDVILFGPKGKSVFATH